LQGVHLHLYGKTEARMGRKMGHLTITAATSAAAKEVSLKAAALLGIAAW
jgi:5-(carboxyamino)imidazole ribonucleotide synthase